MILGHHGTSSCFDGNVLMWSFFHAATCCGIVNCERIHVCRYTEHSTVGLAQQWDQLDQLGMRMQHNLEQQIQAWYVSTSFKILLHLHACIGTQRQQI